MDIEQALRATVFGEPESTATDLARYFAPDYEQMTDGVVSDFAQFLAHIQHVRELVVDGELVVHDKAQEDRIVADRHTVRIVKHDGSAAALEVLLIGEIGPDDRFVRVVETTRLLEGDDSDAGLGSALG